MIEKLSKWKKLKRQMRRAMTPTWFSHVTYQVFAFLTSVAMILGVATYAFTKSYEGTELNLPENFMISARAEDFEVDNDSVAYISAVINNKVEVCEFDVHSRPNRTLVVSQDFVVTNNDGLELTKVFELLKDKDVKVNLNVRMAIDLQELSKLIRQYGMEKSVFITGIETYQISAAKEYFEGIEYYLNYLPSRTKIFSDDYQKKLVTMLDNSGAVGINCLYANAGGRLAEVLHENGYKMSVTGVNNSIQMKRILVCEADNISTAHYSQLKELIENW